MPTSKYLLKEQLLQDFIAAQDQIVVLTAQHGVFLPTHDVNAARDRKTRLSLEATLVDFE
jgi:hypothetical protein